MSNFEKWKERIKRNIKATTQKCEIYDCLNLVSKEKKICNKCRSKLSSNLYEYTVCEQCGELYIEEKEKGGKKVCKLCKIVNNL